MALWMLDQVGEGLNDVFQWEFPPMSAVKSCLLKGLTRLLALGLTLRSRAFGAIPLATERVVEYPVVFSWLPEPKAHILDVGCASSRLPIQLASLGYQVHGLDVRPYPYEHRNFTPCQGDLFGWDPGQRFDVVLLISTLEHMGLGIYGDMSTEQADHQAVQRIKALLRPRGHLIVSIPFGKRGQTARQRIYDFAQIQFLFADFAWRRTAYFKRFGLDWLPTQAEELADVASPLGPTNGVAILDLELPA